MSKLMLKSILIPVYMGTEKNLYAIKNFNLWLRHINYREYYIIGVIILS